MTVGLIGASGFVGTRATERWSLARRFEIRPIVRSFAGLARLSRFTLDCRMADAHDEDAMRSAFAGCDTVVHAVAGDASAVAHTAGPAYRAADAAGVRRLIYLSSASVHGQNPAPDTDERSPLSRRQWSWYNNAKVVAEQRLLAARRRGRTEVVVLRPGIVWGPRSRWVTDFVEGLMNGQAYVVAGGRGVLNSIFVDNLIHAIERAWLSPAESADAEAFIVQDDEEATWRDLYEPLCRCMGRDWSRIPDVAPPPPRLPRLADKIETARVSKIVQRLLPHVPGGLKRSVKAALAVWPEPAAPQPFALQTPHVPVATEEMARLHLCSWRLPDVKAREQLGYRAVSSFADGLETTVRWLTAAGYPVRQSIVRGQARTCPGAP